MMIDFFIEGTPVPKGRPRFSGNGHTYTPAKTKAAEHVVALLARAAMNGGEPLKGPVHAYLTFHMPIYKSWPKAKKESALAGQLAHTFTPDLDNMIKLVTDACNKICYHDDSQIVKISAAKLYSRSSHTTVTFSND
jgi:Holliday junction resolvase RusA-like endonuclease